MASLKEPFKCAWSSWGSDCKFKLSVTQSIICKVYIFTTFGISKQFILDGENHYIRFMCPKYGNNNKLPKIIKKEA